MKKGCVRIVLLFVSLPLILALCIRSLPQSAAKSRPASPAPQSAFAPATAQQTPSGPTVILRAASGATTMFVTQNGRTVEDVPPRMLHLPHLVLHRNGALTGSSERTLIVEVTGIKVPAGGVTVTLKVETQHQDPDLGGGRGGRISYGANPSGSPTQQALPKRAVR